jgi:hypothetical protein
MQPLDVVATMEDIPAAHLAKGQVDTIAGELSKEVVLVESADLRWVAYAIERIPCAIKPQR